MSQIGPASPSVSPVINQPEDAPKQPEATEEAFSRKVAVVKPEASVRVVSSPVKQGKVSPPITSILGRSGKVVLPKAVLVSAPKLPPLPAHLHYAASELRHAKNPAEVETVLTRHIHTSEDLCALCQQVPDDAFKVMKGKVFDHLRKQEASFHFENMMKGCKGSDGEPDPAKLAKTLCQHRGFMADSTANVYFTDGANYVKTRLSTVGSGQLALLQRIRGCGESDLRIKQCRNYGKWCRQGFATG